MEEKKKFNKTEYDAAWRKDHQKRWFADLHFEDFEEIENYRKSLENNLSRADFLKIIFKNYKEMREK